MPHEKVGFENTVSLPRMVSKSYETKQAGCLQKSNMSTTLQHMERISTPEAEIVSAQDTVCENQNHANGLMRKHMRKLQ
jgi:hypothetical protein